MEGVGTGGDGERYGAPGGAAVAVDVRVMCAGALSYRETDGTRTHAMQQHQRSANDSGQRQRRAKAHYTLGAAPTAPSHLLPRVQNYIIERACTSCSSRKTRRCACKRAQGAALGSFARASRASLPSVEGRGAAWCSTPLLPRMSACHIGPWECSLPSVEKKESPHE